MSRTLQLDLRRMTRAAAPPLRDLRRWAACALGRRGHGAELSVLLVTRARSRALNAQYRGRDYATNVLSFPAPREAPGLLGDLVVCPALLRREARAAGGAVGAERRLRAHWAHLIVHGALHLIGFDHEHAGDAKRMERREVTVLRTLGFPDPYRAPPRGRQTHE